NEAPQYRELLEREIGWGGVLEAGLGLPGQRLLIVDAASAAELEAKLGDLETPAEITTAATFAVTEDKRRTIEFAVEHLLGLEDAGAQPEPSRFGLGRTAIAGASGSTAVTGGHARANGSGESVAGAAIALPQGAPFGRLRIDRDACTLCLACVGACPE